MMAQNSEPESKKVEYRPVLVYYSQIPIQLFYSGDGYLLVVDTKHEVLRHPLYAELLDKMRNIRKSYEKYFNLRYREVSIVATPPAVEIEPPVVAKVSRVEKMGNFFVTDGIDVFYMKPPVVIFEGLESADYSGGREMFRYGEPYPRERGSVIFPNLYRTGGAMGQGPVPVYSQRAPPHRPDKHFLNPQLSANRAGIYWDQRYRNPPLLQGGGCFDRPIRNGKFPLYSSYTPNPPPITPVRQNTIYRGIISNDWDPNKSGGTTSSGGVFTRLPFAQRPRPEGVQFPAVGAAAVVRHQGLNPKEHSQSQNNGPRNKRVFSGGRVYFSSAEGGRVNGIVNLGDGRPMPGAGKCGDDGFVVGDRQKLPPPNPETQKNVKNEVKEEECESTAMPDIF